MTLSCTNCDAEYQDWYSQGRCLDCGSQLRHSTTGALIPLPDQIDEEAQESLESWIARRDAMFVATSNEIPGYDTVAFHGDVMGITVLARNVFSNMGANLRQIVGGEVGAYVKLLTDGRELALSRMRAEAMRCCADAVIAMRLDANQISDVMTELIAYGTTVSIRERGTDVQI